MSLNSRQRKDWCGEHPGLFQRNQQHPVKTIWAYPVLDYMWALCLCLPQTWGNSAHFRPCGETLEEFRVISLKCGICRSWGENFLQLTFLCEVNWTLAGFWRGCGVSIPWYIQKPSGHASEQPAPGDRAGAGGLNWMISRGPFQLQPLWDSVKDWTP